LRESYSFSARESSAPAKEKRPVFGTLRISGYPAGAAYLEGKIGRSSRPMAADPPAGTGRGAEDIVVVFILRFDLSE